MPLGWRVLFKPAKVRSIPRSRSNSATAAITLHCHLVACRAGVIDAALGETMHPDAGMFQLGHGATQVHHVAAQAVQLRDNKNINPFKAVKQLGEAWPLTGYTGVADGFFNHPLWLDCEASCDNLRKLVADVLVTGRHAAVGKCRAHLLFILLGFDFAISAHGIGAHSGPGAEADNQDVAGAHAVANGLANCALRGAHPARGPA